MTHEQLIVAQAEAFTILRDLMHIKPDDPRPQRIINTIKQAALAILRLKPLSPGAPGERTPSDKVGSGEGKSRDAGEDTPSRQRGAGEGRLPVPNSIPSQSPAASTECTHDAVESLPEEQFDELIARLPHNTLYPRTDKQRDRLARHFAAYHLPCTDDVKAAIVNRASRRSSHSGTDPQGPPREAPRRAA